MIRAIILATLLMTGITPAIAQDNNPFSGATSISVEMTREKPAASISGQFAHLRKFAKWNQNTKRDAFFSSSYPRQQHQRVSRRKFRLRCTLDGKPFADWRGHRVKLDGEWVDVPPDAAGPMMVLLWAGGARCAG